MSEIIYTQDLKELEEQTGIHIETIQTNHQGECIVVDKHKECDVCYIPDNQLHNTTITAFNDFVEFCANSRVLIHDSQYTDTDMPHKIGLGHSLYTDALELAIQSNVDHFVLFHHEPTRSKNEILKLVDHCKSITDSNKYTLEKKKKVSIYWVISYPVITGLSPYYYCRSKQYKIYFIKKFSYK